MGNNLNSESIFAFVLMPFDKSFDDIYKMGIKETAAQLDIIAERVDEQIFQEGILERIYRQIDTADIIIADMSGQNANVFYEVGYAHAKEKICILLTSNTNDIPFDLKHHRHIVYGDSISGLRDLLTEELVWAINEIENIKASHIKVNIKSLYGDLHKTKSAARGTANFIVDLLNESKKTSAEIEAIYFYTTGGWSFEQDGKDCPSTESDIPRFDKRHFLTPPLRKLHKNSWAQLKFTGSKYLAFAHRGDEIKDEYKITGKSIIRLVTSAGNFDYEFILEVVCSEVPF
jgi:nucleoside 2-deoxyribosyltransferase